MTPPEVAPPIALQAYEVLAERYHRLGPTKPHNAYYDRPATLALLPDVQGRRVLDAGCGPGLYSEWLLARGAEVVAFDISPQMLRFFRERNGGRATLHRANLEEPLHFLADATFDVVLCALALDYVREWRTTFAEFARVLKPGALLVASLLHPAADFFLRHSGGSYFEVEQVVEQWSFGTEEPVAMHRYRHPLQHLFAALEDAGFQLERLVEPRPTEAFRQADADEYDNLMRQPAFLCIRARKPGP